MDSLEFETVMERLHRLELEVQKVAESMASIESMVRSVVAEVKPTLDSLMGNPMLRMALGIKK